jgi:tetratricopeptide (TPR) repeat protein
MKQSYILLSFLLILLSTSCSDKKAYPTAMQQAENCIVAHPDSAAFYLSTLESTIKDEPKETQMYYALLATKAKDKQYMTHTSDSLMKVVTHFYENYGDADKLMESYYYLASVFRDMKDTPRAIKAFQQAADAGENSKRYDVLGRIYQKMGVLFAYQSLYDEAMQAAKKSYVYFEQDDDTLGIAFSFRDVARMYNENNQQDSAIYFYSKALENAELTNNDLVTNSFLSEFGAFYIEHNNLNLGKHFLSKISNIHNYPTALYGFGVIYQNMHQDDSAKYYLNMAIRQNNIYMKKKSYKLLSEMEAKETKFHLAFDYAYKSLTLEDSITTKIKTEAIGKINALYNYQHTEKKNQQLLLENDQRKNQIYLLIIGLLLTVGKRLRDSVL